MKLSVLCLYVSVLFSYINFLLRQTLSKWWQRWLPQAPGLHFTSLTTPWKEYASFQIILEESRNGDSGWTDLGMDPSLDNMSSPAAGLGLAFCPSPHAMWTDSGGGVAD